MRRFEPSRCEGELGPPSDVGGVGAALSFRCSKALCTRQEPSVPLVHGPPLDKIMMKDNGKVLYTRDMS